MKSGETERPLFYLRTSAGRGRRYANAAAAAAAGWSFDYRVDNVDTALSYTLTPIDDHDAWESETIYSDGDFAIPSTPSHFIYEVTTAGTTAASEPTWPTTLGDTVTDGTVVWTCRPFSGAHRLAFTLSTGRMFLRPVPPYGFYSHPDAYLVDVQANDSDSVAAALNSSVGTTGVVDIQSESLGTVTVGDAFKTPSMQIAASDASQIHGVTDFTGYLVTAGMRLEAGGTAAAISDADWVSASDRTIYFAWTTMPSLITDYFTANPTEESLTVYIDIQVTKSDASEPFTYLKRELTIVWDRKD